MEYKKISCPCGNTFGKYYDDAVPIFNTRGACYQWKCLCCGQQFNELIKEPLNIDS